MENHEEDNKEPQQNVQPAKCCISASEILIDDNKDKDNDIQTASELNFTLTTCSSSFETENKYRYNPHLLITAAAVNCDTSSGFKNFKEQPEISQCPKAPSNSDMTDEFDVDPYNDSLRIKYEKINQQLLQKNEGLFKDLKDIKLELMHVMEKLDGSIYHQIEAEKRKSQKLEVELLRASEGMANKECYFMETLDQMQQKLNTTCGELCELSAINERLKHDMTDLQIKYNKLQQEFVKRKLNEMEMLESLSNTLVPTCQTRVENLAKEEQRNDNSPLSDAPTNDNKNL